MNYTMIEIESYSNMTKISRWHRPRYQVSVCLFSFLLVGEDGEATRARQVDNLAARVSFVLVGPMTQQRNICNIALKTPRKV